MNSSRNVTISTDGGCWPNTGAGNGGWAFVIRRYYGHNLHVERAGMELGTTNNRMELTAIFEALSELNSQPNSIVTIRSDSKYCINACTIWGDGWERNGWLLRSKQAKGQPVKNRDLIESIRDLCKRHTVKFRWVKGHYGDVDNERCDELASAMVRKACAEARKSMLTTTPAQSLLATVQSV